MFGICNLSIIPCRKEPSDRSEMVTQLLFGDHFEILEVQGSWCRIKIAYDDYECWTDKNTSQPFPIVIGSTLPNFDDGECAVENTTFIYDGAFITGNLPFTKSGI